MSFLLHCTTFCWILLQTIRPVPDNAPGHWQSLFNGKNLDGWRTYRHKPADSWEVKDGILHNIGNANPQTKHADLITREKYGDFDLQFDWKIAPAGNSGILYHVTEDYEASYLSGPEYQLIDDKGYPQKLADWQKTGANYAMDPPEVDATKPAGEWNHSEIMVHQGKVIHRLNGKQVCAYTFYDKAWKEHKAAGKWKDAAGYGMAASGYIAIQDHGGEIWLKNLLIKTE
ncbi:MAG TPA: DUF1080 domain-containing protein [Sediminibacterium sp.]|nr:DUF1080 domain-containing protein [Sediminibacterium sp.]